MASSVNVIMTKPTVLIYCTGNVRPEAMQNLCFGIEEEGLPYDVQSVPGSNACLAAHNAAVESALAVGIGCDETDVYLHSKNLPEELFMFKLSGYSRHPFGLRVLGVNAARLAKGEPFRMDHELETSF